MTTKDKNLEGGKVKPKAYNPYIWTDKGVFKIEEITDYGYDYVAVTAKRIAEASE